MEWGLLCRLANGLMLTVHTAAGVLRLISASPRVQTVSALLMRIALAEPAALHMVVGAWAGTVMISGLRIAATVITGTACLPRFVT